MGGGKSAVEEALYLANIAKKVTLIHRRDKFRAEPILLDRLHKKIEEGKVELKVNCVVEPIVGNDTGVTGVEVRDHMRALTELVEVQGCFIAIGHQPNTALFDGQLATADGYIQTRSGLEGYATATSVPDVFAAGDVQDRVYRQAVTSAGTGCMTALDAQRFLDS